MRTMHLNRDEFMEAMNAIKELHELKASLYKLGFDTINCKALDNIETQMVKLLDKIYFNDIGDEKLESDIGYFIYELDWGKEYKHGCISTLEGEYIQLATLEDLWNDIIETNIKYGKDE